MHSNFFDSHDFDHRDFDSTREVDRERGSCRPESTDSIAVTHE